jgi:hypothetical protein
MLLAPADRAEIGYLPIQACQLEQAFGTSVSLVHSCRQFICGPTWLLRDRFVQQSHGKAYSSPNVQILHMH